MKKLFVFFALCAGMLCAPCFGAGKDSVLSPKAYKYRLLDDGTVFVKVDLSEAPKSFTIPAEVEGSKVSKVEIKYEVHYGFKPLPDVEMITVSEGIQEFKCEISDIRCKKLILADSIKLMQIEVTGLESINIPKGVTEFDGWGIGGPSHKDNESHLKLRSPQMEELVIPAHVTAVHTGGIRFDAGRVCGSKDYYTLEPKTEKITFENPNVKFTKAYIEDYSIRADSDTPLKLQQCVQEINKKAEVVKKH